MTATTNRRIVVKITLHANGTTEIAAFLVEDGKQARLEIPPLAHPDAVEGFIFALAARHGVGAEAIETVIDDQRSAGRRPPVSGRVLH